MIGDDPTPEAMAEVIRELQGFGVPPDRAERMASVASLEVGQHLMAHAMDTDYAGVWRLVEAMSGDEAKEQLFGTISASAGMMKQLGPLGDMLVNGGQIGGFEVIRIPNDASGAES